MLNENLLNQSRRFGRLEYRVIEFISEDLARVQIIRRDSEGELEGMSYILWNEGQLADAGFTV